MLSTSKMTIRIPESDLTFASTYAKSQGLTLTALVLRHFRALAASMQQEIPSEVAKVTGLVPRKAAAREDFYEGMAKKHR